MRILNEAKYLQKLGALTRLCTYHIGENIVGIDIARIKGPACYKKISPGFSWGKIWLDLKMLFLVRREIRKYNPDIIHAHLYEGLVIGFLAKEAAFKKIPIVFDLQGNINEEFKSYSKKNNLARKFFVWLAKIVINWADKIVVSSENVGCRCPTPTTVIKDGIDLELFQDQPKADPPLAEMEKIKKWAGDSKLLVYIGGLSDNKGVGELLKVFKKLQELGSWRNNSWKLLLGGFGEDEEKYKKYTTENNLEKSVYFAGKVKYFSLPRYLALASAGIDPKSGSTESSGKLMNLMAAGLPIVCFENDFNRARLGDKGLYLKTFDDLPGILENITSAKKISYNLENLSEEKEARKLFEIFDNLVK